MFPISPCSRRRFVFVSFGGRRSVSGCDASSVLVLAGLFDLCTIFLVSSSLVCAGVEWESRWAGTPGRGVGDAAVG